jgi:hypothetical protein
MDIVVDDSELFNTEDNTEDNIDDNIDYTVNNSVINSIIRLRSSFDYISLNRSTLYQTSYTSSASVNISPFTSIFRPRFAQRHISPFLYINAIYNILENDDNTYYDDLEDVKITLNDDEYINLETIEYTDEKDQQLKCSICLESFNSDKLKKLKCAHVYHDECIKSWLMNQSIKCPICRMSQRM